ncbi:hypothetical protein [Salinimonas chungwhensis]|uniref:hypothetical protein n=1 Tax=Salinimonas chungwhensis TaxID=265425 RepID=UPI00036F4A27|nr:hypothetical protein [Salinimonas chungwhensis]
MLIENIKEKVSPLSLLVTGLLLLVTYDAIKQRDNTTAFSLEIESLESQECLLETDMDKKLDAQKFEEDIDKFFDCMDNRFALIDKNS